MHMQFIFCFNPKSGHNWTRNAYAVHYICLNIHIHLTKYFYINRANESKKCTLKENYNGKNPFSQGIIIIISFSLIFWLILIDLWNEPGPAQRKSYRFVKCLWKGPAFKSERSSFHKICVFIKNWHVFHIFKPKC